MTTHLVTGGSGFIGSRLALRLHQAGDKVRILDLVRDPGLPPDIEFHQGSVCDHGAVAEAMRGVNVLHHHAALVAQSNAGRRYGQVNVEGSRIVAQEAVRAGVNAFVHVSSTAVFGLPPKGAITNATVPRPFEAYGRSKLAAELIVSDICGSAGIPLIIIRPRATLGKGRLGIYQILFQWIAEGRRLFIIGDGSNRMQFIHADDLVDFILLALASGRPGTYNVGTSRFSTLRQDLEGLIAHAGSPSRIVDLPVAPAMAALGLLHQTRLSPLVPWQYRTYHRDCWFDTAPLEDLGWTARYSNADMLAESYDWFRAHRSVARSGSAHRSPVEQHMIGLLRRLS
ncbi:MAG TPA: NAD-dependent epimerase/dehydratase family protein [Sphingobium sp.]|nr:NAD-dependent epimerase/dehydratase family protein [Sphingobium sp.]